MSDYHYTISVAFLSQQLPLLAASSAHTGLDCVLVPKNASILSAHGGMAILFYSLVCYTSLHSELYSSIKKNMGFIYLLLFSCFSESVILPPLSSEAESRLDRCYAAV